MLLDFVSTTRGQTANLSGYAEGESVPGMRGVATQRAVMHFSELPQEGTPSRLEKDLDPPVPASNFPALDGVDPRPPTPDTMGAVGPKHLMVVLNHGVRIQDRSGSVISTVSPSNFWAAVGPLAPFYFPDGAPAYATDPRVFYDPYDNRWLISAFHGAPTVPGSLLVEVSQTSDPTGQWNLYRIQVDQRNG